MARPPRRESVTATFHYLVKEDVNDEGEPVTTPFLQADFDALADRLEHLAPLDLTDDEVKDMLRYKRGVPIEDVETLDPRTIFGLYKGAYWGHSYFNTDVGDVPASSISLRPFYFLLYLSDSGRIYVCTQYLAQFGSYEGLKKTLVHLLGGNMPIAAHSFRLGAIALETVAATELQIEISSRPVDDDLDNVFRKNTVIAFKKSDRTENFQREIHRRLGGLMGADQDLIRRAAADIIAQSELHDVRDEDIADCTVIGLVNGKRRVVSLIEAGKFASAFGLDVEFTPDGHPTRNSARDKLLDLLRERVIARAENA